MRPQLKNKELIKGLGYIEGVWVKEAQDFFEVDDPATGEIIAKLPEHDIPVMDRAIDAADKAFKKYKNVVPRQRATWLRNLYNLMNENAEDLAKIITWENGKALVDARGEIKYAASYFEWYAEEAPRIYGATIQPGNPNNRVFTARQPVGVCGIICPWNFPSAMITRKVGAALAAGCTVVVKPDSHTPLSALAMAVLVEQAGFPKGVFNVVLSHHNTPKLGKRLCEHPKVKKITFTGSTNVGKILMDQSSSTLKKCSFELGGNAPFIVFGDADIDLAVEQAIASKFRGLGQTCVCTNRFYVHSSVIDEFTSKLVGKVKQFKIGDGMKEGVTHGCLTSSKQANKVNEHTEDAIKKGAEVVLKGGPMTDLGKNFYSPVVLKNVPQSAIVAKEETFGPLCPVFSFDTLEEVVGYANDTELGLASYVFSKNVNTLITVSEAIEAGMVSCNTGLFSDSAVPFGGVKESGFGREGSLYGIEDYTVVKSTIIGNLPDRL